MILIGSCAAGGRTCLTMGGVGRCGSGDDGGGWLASLPSRSSVVSMGCPIRALTFIEGRLYSHPPPANLSLYSDQDRTFVKF